MLEEELPSRYIVGVDLGTTNSAAAYVDTAEDPWRIRAFRVPQLVAPGQVEARDTLPSFHYEPAPGELGPGALQLPWRDAEPTHAVGVFARDQGALVPGRLIASAKSWLCHTGVDRTAPLLPWHGAADVERLSPVEASARYLEHLRRAWDHAFPEHPLASQDFVLTLPASFDEIARELTVQAAARAGLTRVMLIEEPQAAFYAWIDKHAGQWQDLVTAGQKILVCDIGGGTTDFTLIRVRQGQDGRVQFHRVAVGDHLILAGDNLDLALAKHLEGKLASGGQLASRQWDSLVRACRVAKETLLGPNPPDRYTLHVAGGGARLLGGGTRVEVSREEVQSLLLDGFFPLVALDDRPIARRSGFQEFGLPFAPDAAITKYLAKFLTDHRFVALDEIPEEQVAGTRTGTGDIDPARPDVLLFNGGVLESSQIRERLVTQLCQWFRGTAEPDWAPLVLANERLDLAVARGAAYYGMVRRGVGVRIAAELARTYYIGVESGEGGALCLVPAKAHPGEDVHLPQQFQLRVSEPVEFPLFVSSTRLVDQPGDLVPFDAEQMRALPPIRTVLRTRRRSEATTATVTLHARLSEIGTIELWCEEVDGERTWRLEFDVRSATQTDIAQHAGAGERSGFVEETEWEGVRQLLHGAFGTGGKEAPQGIVKQIEKRLESGRWNWPPSLLRRIWEELMELEPGRRRGPVHEERWLNLLGFSLRPGYGMAADDWRVTETWRSLYGKLVHATPACRTEWWIQWRRVAGGLSAGQQRALADPLLGPLRVMHRKLTSGQGKGEVSFGPQESIEIWRLLGSLELLPVASKIELGNMICDLIPRKKLAPLRPALVWALGRVGARAPVYGPLNGVVAAEIAGGWAERLMQSGPPQGYDALALMQLARKTDDRYRDLAEALRRDILHWLTANGAAEHLSELVRHVAALAEEEQTQIVGDALPRGLRVGTAAE